MTWQEHTVKHILLSIGEISFKQFAKSPHMINFTRKDFMINTAKHLLEMNKKQTKFPLSRASNIKLWQAPPPPPSSWGTGKLKKNKARGGLFYLDKGEEELKGIDIISWGEVQLWSFFVVAASRHVGQLNWSLCCGIVFPKEKLKLLNIAGR